MRVNELFGWIMPFIVKDVQNITKEHSMVEEDMDLEEEQDKEKDEPLKKKKKWNPEKLRVYFKINYSKGRIRENKDFDGIFQTKIVKSKDIKITPHPTKIL